jgi:UDP-sugar transporter A1/2/3
MNTITWIALVALVVQNSFLSICMRYTFIHNDGNPYITSTAVLLAEILKLVISTIVCITVDSKGNMSQFLNTCYVDMMKNSRDWFKLMVPSILYTLQNSLQYYSMSCLSAPVFQVLYQMKIITTAVFSVLILSKRLISTQWLSVFSLACGIALVQLSQTVMDEGKANSIYGLISVLCGCLTSGFAGVYFELVLKQTNASIWMRNIQLSAIGIVVSIISCYMRDKQAILDRGFLSGYNEYVVAVIVLQAAGGLIVAVVVKYADNVLKGFATSVSILLSALVSWKYFHDIEINSGFVIGSSTVLASVYLYGYVPPINSSRGMLGMLGFGSDKNLAEKATLDSV